MDKPAKDPAMERANELFAGAGISLGDLGMGMGYSDDVSRKAAWQFLHKTADPRLSMLRRFASAMGLSVVELLEK